MEQLNLPEAALQLRRDSRGRVQVYDRLRGKWIVLTPEEWVRQNFVEYLITCLGYPAGRMGNEVSLTLNGTMRRCDTVVFGDDRTPLMIIEYKAPEVTITKEVFSQILRYNSVLKAPYLIVSNGLSHYACKAEFSPLSCSFLKQPPAWEQISGNSL